MVQRALRLVTGGRSGTLNHRPVIYSSEPGIACRRSRGGLGRSDVALPISQYLDERPSPGSSARGSFTNAGVGKTIFCDSQARGVTAAVQTAAPGVVELYNGWVVRQDVVREGLPSCVESDSRSCSLNQHLPCLERRRRQVIGAWLEERDSRS